jgi:hypothetical protein
MKGGTLSVLLMAACAVVAFATPDYDFKPDFNRLEERLDEFTSRLMTLEHKIEKRVDKDRINKARGARSLVEALTGNGCAAREFQCGGSDPQCVSALMVCDGIQDCRNGKDEDDCRVPLSVGDVFEGHMVWDRCTKRQPSGMTLRVTGVTRSSFFQPFAKVNVDIGIDVVNNKIRAHVELPTKGMYSTGLRRLVLMPPESDRLGLVCQFGAGSQDRCIGTIKHEASLDECAKLIFVRK